MVMVGLEKDTRMQGDTRGLTTLTNYRQSSYDEGNAYGMLAQAYERRRPRGSARGFERGISLGITPSSLDGRRLPADLVEDYEESCSVSVILFWIRKEWRLNSDD